jgi:hypothetical protein
VFAALTVLQRRGAPALLHSGAGGHQHRDRIRHATEVRPASASATKGRSRSSPIGTASDDRIRHNQPSVGAAADEGSYVKWKALRS